jgi:phenylacetate-CoA ligase
MSDTLLRLYHHLPYPFRVLVASARGYHLRRWRYGPETEQLVEKALEREQWSPEQWKARQEERLAYVLHRAATKVPYYQEYWLQRRRHGDQASGEVLENWPILKKETLRENPRAFVAEDCDTRHMFHEHTSGISGKPLSLWWSRETVRAWYALFEARIRIWNEVSRDDRWAILGGQVVTSFDQIRPPFWVWNAGLRQLYMSSYHLAPDYIPAYLEALARYQVTYMFGYASSMYGLAQIALEKGLEAPSLEVAISNAEPLYQHQRESIAQAFQCPVRDTYGMAEIVAAASECQAGTLHLWPEVGIIEVMHDDVDELVPPGQSGRFICTGLLNADMPLIRYEIGDRGALAPEGKACACGRTLPILQEVEGRSDDIVLTPDGRCVGRLDPVFKADLPIREAQIIQESLERVRVRFVPATGYMDRDGIAIMQRLRDRVGNMEIVLEQVDHIPRSASGKFRAVISKVNVSGS